SIPLLKSNGALLLALSFYLYKGLDNPERQLLIVDTLLVILLGQSVITMSAVQSGMYSFWDWLSLAVYVGLGISLMKNRVKEKDVPQAAAPQETPPLQAE